MNTKPIYTDSLDPVAAVPKFHEILLENDEVRVLRVRKNLKKSLFIPINGTYDVCRTTLSN